MRLDLREADRPVSRHWQRRIHFILWTGLLCAGAAYAWFTIFATFREYDDEGYMMMTIRHLLDGHRLYDQVPTAYGPAHYLYKWLIHGLLRVPLNNDTTRLATLALWLASAGGFSWLVYCLYRPGALAMPAASVCFVASLLHLQALTGEPGHPQELVPALLAMGLLAGAFAGEGRRRWLFVLGLIGGTLLAAKLNVGVLFLSAAAMALVMEYGNGFAARAGSAVLGTGIILLPAVLMRRHLSAGWCQQFCVVAMLGIVACWVVALRQRAPSGRRAPLLLWGVAGMMLASLGAVGFVLIRGSMPCGIVQCLVIRAMRFPEIFCFPIPHASGGIWYAAAGAGLAVLYALRRGRLTMVLENIVVPALKVVMAAAILVQCASWYLLPSSGYTQSWYLLPFTSPGWHFEYAVGFLWMTMAIPPGREASVHELMFRRLIAIVSALQILQMYPVPGSQAAVGTAGVPAIAAMWAADVAGWMPRRPTKGTEARGHERAKVGLAAACAVSVGLIGVLGWLARERYRAYTQLDRVDLPGFRLTRLPEDRAALYRCLADSVRGRTFICNTGLNSLYFWSQTRPASTIVIGDAWGFLSDADQAELLANVGADPRLLYIHRPWIFPPPSEPSLVQVARREFTPVGRVGPFIINARAGQSDVELKSCAWAKPSAGNTKRLEVKLRDQTQHWDCRILQLSLPGNLAEQRITDIALVDLARGRVLAKTQSAVADKLLILLDRDDRILLPDNGERTGVTLPGNTEAWRLAIPVELQLERYAMPAVRLYRGRNRIATLPLAVSCAGLDGASAE